MIRQQLSDAVARLVQDTFGIDGVVPAIEMPKNPSYGDFATNVAFSLTKELRRKHIS